MTEVVRPRSVTSATRPRGLTSDLAVAVLGRGVTAAYTFGAVAILGFSAEADLLISATTHGALVTLTFLQLASQLALAEAARGRFGSREMRRLRVVAAVASAFLVLSTPIALPALGLPTTSTAMLLWGAASLSVSLGAEAGILVGTAHAHRRARFRFLVPFGPPVSALCALAATHDLRVTGLAWLIGWIIDVLLLRRLVGAPDAAAAVTLEVPERPLLPLAASQVGYSTTALAQQATLNRLDNGATAAYYTADRLVLAAVGIVGSVIAPRVLLRAADGAVTRLLRLAIRAQYGTAALAVIVGWALSRGQAPFFLTCLAVLALGAPTFFTQQLLSAALVGRGRAAVSAVIAWGSVLGNLVGLALAGVTGVVALVPMTTVLAGATAVALGQPHLRSSASRPFEEKQAHD